MKKIITPLLIIFLNFFCKNALCKEPIKVAVLPWSIHAYIDAATNEQIFKKEDSLQEKVLEDIYKRIESLGFKRSNKKFGMDDEQEAVEFYFGSGQNFTFPYPASREKYDADIIIFLQSPGDKKLEKEYTAIQLVGVEAGKEAVTLFKDTDVNNDNFSKILSEKISQGLERSKELLSVKAEKIGNPEESIVEYIFPTNTGEAILMNLDYDSDGENLQNVSFDFTVKQKQDGTHIFWIPTKDNNKISVIFSVNQNKITNVKFETDYKPQSLDQKEQRTFIARSKDGYEINFEFFGKGQLTENVKIYPKLKPYLPRFIEF